MSSFSLEQGYIPSTFQELVDAFMLAVNEEFDLEYDESTFEGSGWYKFAYAVWQKVGTGETKTAEVFLKLQEYIRITNERIQRPSVSTPGLIESLQSEGFVAALKPPSDEDAGKIYVCVDLDDGAEDYGEKKLEVCTLLSGFTAAGLVFQGTEEELITLSNGQQFSFKFFLPDLIPALLRITVIPSENTTLLVPDDEEIRIQALAQLRARYRLGLNFEPQRYYTPEEAPWAASITLEWSDDDGETWHPEVYDADFDELFDFDLEDIAVTIT